MFSVSVPASLCSHLPILHHHPPGYAITTLFFLSYPTILRPSILSTWRQNLRTWEISSARRPFLLCYHGASEIRPYDRNCRCQANISGAAKTSQAGPSMAFDPCFFCSATCGVLGRRFCKHLQRHSVPLDFGHYTLDSASFRRWLGHHLPLPVVRESSNVTPSAIPALGAEPRGQKTIRRSTSIYQT